MARSPQPNYMNQSRAIKISFLAGSITSSVIFLLIVSLLGYRIGVSNLLDTVWRTVGVDRSSSSGGIVYLPEKIVRELVTLDAVVNNADNPTKQRPHDTILVRPDKEFKFVLRPNARISGFVLKTLRQWNLDPPVLYLKSESKVSGALRDYLDDQARLTYSYSIDAKGFRRTVPEVESQRKILLVGDSVLFGVGVDDDSTIASHLQRLVGQSVRVVNAGVGNYDGAQVFQIANKLSKKDKYDALIYIACENDFADERTNADLAKAKDIMKQFESIKDKFSDRVIVVLSTYLQYSIHDIVLEGGRRSREAIDNTHILRTGLRAVTKDVGFEYIDWTDLVNNYMKSERSIWSRFALYVDHVHLSPRGNRLVAEKLLESLRAWTLVS